MGLAIHAGAGVMGADVLWRPGWLSPPLLVWVGTDPDLKYEVA